MAALSSPARLFLFGGLQGPLDLFVRALLAAVNRLGVEAEEDSDTVAGPPRDLSREDSGLKPE
ncbi:hypothetical protein [Streptomyces glaucus]|uniref:hypothetical protein n=1 Tax=Streptomyces glaucus TaxID=284029 RepID=UPI003CD08129